MEVEEIPSNQLIEMTEIVHSSFKKHGCDPMCHCCNKVLIIGGLFKLSTVRDAVAEANNGLINKDKINLIKSGKDKIELSYNGIDFTVEEKDLFKPSRDVMLCDECTPELYEDKEKRKILKYHISGGCFRINGKIVH